MPETVPMPLEWHPAYADQTWLLDWLATQEPYLVMDIPRPFRVSDLDESLILVRRTMMLRKRRAAGPAPYVGRPFRYVWTVATDDVGRSIAGDAERVYDS